MSSNQEILRPLISTRFIRPDDAAVIQFQLSLIDQNVEETKNGLQRLCTAYELGLRLERPGPIRLAVIPLAGSTHILIRRWAYKALAWIGRPEDADLLIGRLAVEADMENLTWAMAALVVRAVHRDVRELAAASRIDQTPSLLLAGRLFSPRPLIVNSPELPRVDVGSEDHLLLKWGALLAGYGRAPTDLFTPNHSISASLADLNGHDDPQVAEYSVWALWKSLGLGLSNFGRPLHSLMTLPPNVRRWAYRLLTKQRNEFHPHINLLQELARDDDEGAREGLALGLRHLDLGELPPIILDWYQDELSERVRHSLLEHMASNVTLSGDYGYLVTKEFSDGIGNERLRRKLLAAAGPTPFHTVLKRLQVEEEFAHKTLDLLTVGGSSKGLHMTNTTVNIIGHGNAIGSVTGDVIASSVTAVANMSAERADEKAYLEEVMRFVEHEELRGSERKALSEAVAEVAKSPDPSKKANLLGLLQTIASSTGAVVTISEHAGKLIEIGKAAFGL